MYRLQIMKLRIKYLYQILTKTFRLTAVKYKEKREI